MSVYGSDQNCYCIFQKRNTFLRKGFLPISRNTWEKIAGLFIKCSLPETSRPFILVKWKMVQHCIRAAALYYYHDTTIYYLVLLYWVLRIWNSGDVCHHFLPKDRIDFTLEQIHCYHLDTTMYLLPCLLRSRIEKVNHFFHQLQLLRVLDAYIDAFLAKLFVIE